MPESRYEPSEQIDGDPPATFISYSSKNSQQARIVVNHLEAKGHHSVALLAKQALDGVVGLENEESRFTVGALMHNLGHAFVPAWRAGIQRSARCRWH